MKVETTSNPYNLAYSNVAIHLHTDLPYYNYCPGVRFSILHFSVLVSLSCFAAGSDASLHGAAIWQ